MNNGKAITNYKKVLFSDLDETIITTLSGKEFPIGCYDMKPKLESIEAIKNYKPDVVIIITNQGGIKAGFVNDNFLRNKLMWVSSIIAEYCGCDCYFRYCPNTDVNDPNRKPNPGMVVGFIKECGVDKEYLMIGDRPEDEGCAKNANIPYMDVKEFINKFKTK